jgi:hypothetical protein
MLPPVKNEEEARRIMRAGLGRAELEFATSITAPLYWIIREAKGRYRVHNGSAFFLDAGSGVFGVTANHVIDGWRSDRGKSNVVALQLGLDLQLDFSGKNAIIAAHSEIDIATFRVTAAEIKSIGKQVLTGYQKVWPQAHHSKIAVSTIPDSPAGKLFGCRREGSHSVPLQEEVWQPA